MAIGGNTSAASDYLDSSPQMNRYAIAPDDLATRVVIPGTLALELNSENNGYGQDLEILLTRRQQDEVDVTLRSYHVGAYKALFLIKKFLTSRSRTCGNAGSAGLERRPRSRPTQ